MMRSERITVTILLIMALGTCVIALPESPTDSMTNSTDTWKTYSATVQSIAAQGANYTNMNLSAQLQTNNWAVIYGEVDAIKVFKSQSGNQVYSWSGTGNDTGHIFFTNDTNVNWGTLHGDAVATHLYGEDNRLGLNSLDSDSVNRTFWESSANNPVINYTGCNSGSGIQAGTAWTIQTNNDTGAFWYTSFVYDSANVPVYAGFLEQNRTAFNGDEADYQVMIPTADNSRRTYYIYLALE